MRNWMPAALPAVVAGLFSGHGQAAEMNLTFELPRLNVAEYHRPYVAIWVEQLDQNVATNLAVLYDLRTKGAEGAGSKWLKDLRTWWRKSGRELQMPMDGVSGATKPAGEHTLSFVEGKAPLAKLPAGEYRLVIEAARESGGREVVKLPFSWPSKKAQRLSAAGSSELGAIQLELKP